MYDNLKKKNGNFFSENYKSWRTKMMSREKKNSMIMYNRYNWYVRRKKVIKDDLKKKKKK